MIYLLIAGISAAVVGLFFLFRWLFSPYRVALRKNRRACRRGDKAACAEYDRLNNQGKL